MNYYKVLANSSEEQVCALAAKVTEAHQAASVKLLSGPRLGLVMLRMQESVAESQFNAGEVLVTEVRLELDGQFGFGMVRGDQPRTALAIALIDAALRKQDTLAEQISHDIAELARHLELKQQHEYRLVATSKVDFETM